jgi:hypothetical protein
MHFCCLKVDPPPQTDPGNLAWLSRNQNGALWNDRFNSFTQGTLNFLWRLGDVSSQISQIQARQV